ncbi:MAG: nucleotidyltransferase family protein [Magnetococcales bacterium]|nr:nucleotidyltransferase family protein [Magnetococcales bacterium]
MRSWRAILVHPEHSILEAVRVMDQGALGAVLVVNHQQRLLGVVTDGDVRRGLLQRIRMEAPVTTVMCDTPTVAKMSDSKEHIFALMRTRSLNHVPIVDDDYRLVGLETLKVMVRPQPRDNWVVLMAGGLGSRLGPLTERCPKPLLHVGSQPILEIILESFIEQGFYQFFLSVNYKKEMIQDYFGDGSRWGVSIDYLEENERCGTAGSLALLPDRPELPFFVMNGDLLTRINFIRALDFHVENEVQATMCVRKVAQTVPYGVVELESSHRLLRIVEKPVEEYLVNAGIYMLNPEVLSLIPSSGYFDMTDLFRRVIEAGYATSAFPFLEYWLDIGRMGDFQQACQDYPRVFNMGPSRLAAAS